MKSINILAFEFYLIKFVSFQDKIEHLDLIEGIIVDILTTKWDSFIKKQ